MATTKTFRVSGIAALLSIACLVAGKLWGEGWTVLGVLLAIGAWPTFLVSVLRHVFRRLLWRVGTRLLVSYLLIGIVPLPIFVGLAYLATVMLSGQLAARRVEAALAARREALEQAIDRVEDASAAERPARLAEVATELDASWAWKPAAATPPNGEGPYEPARLLPADAAGGVVLARQEKRSFLAAHLKDDGGEALLYVPVDDALQAELEKETGIVVRFADAKASPKSERRKAKEKTKEKGAGIAVGITDDEADTEIDFEEMPPSKTPVPKPTPAAVPRPRGPFRGRWVAWVAVIPGPVIEWPKGTPDPKARVVGLIQTSIAREMGELFAGSRIHDGEDSIDTGKIVRGIMKGHGAFAAFVYLCAGALAALLVFRIARATSRLTAAFRELEAGRFGVTAQLSGHDQLAELVGGFNRMSGHLAVAVSERARQEAVRRELDVARELQRRLLPPPDAAFAGYEIAADFRPAAEIGGDFYHLAEEGDGLFVAIADVSGHGLATGIVMAAAKASLSTLIATRTPRQEIFASLDRELRATTEPRTFVTLTLARFVQGSVELTSAGHMPPYRVTPAGAVSSADLPSRPLGLASTRGVSSPSALVGSAPGDLWVFFSDGIVEALSPAGEVFGFARLESLLGSCAGCSARDVVDRVLASPSGREGRSADESSPAGVTR
jgi:sigma-B regulation protein RsbU (phosphoserine phosphatase)